MTVAMASLAIFVVAMAFLLIRLESGLDPAIAVGEHTSPGTQKRTLVLERRTVVTDRASDEPGGVAATTQIPADTPAPTPTTHQS